MAAPAHRLGIERMLRVAAAVSAGLVASGLALRLAPVAGTEWILPAGLITLVSLPALRLIAVLAAFARDREWPFVLAGAVVVGLLIVTLFWRVS